MRILSFIALFIAFMGAPILGQPARADEAKFQNPSIAVVDLQALLRESNAAKDIEKQIGEIRKSFQAEITKEETALRDAEKKILDERNTLKKEDFEKKASDFQKRVGESQKKIQDRKDKLDRAMAEAVNKLRAEVVKIVADLGDKNKLDLVVARTDVVIVSKDMDITAPVMEQLNKNLPSVKVNVP